MKGLSNIITISKYEFNFQLLIIPLFEIKCKWALFIATCIGSGMGVHLTENRRDANSAEQLATVPCLLLQEVCELFCMIFQSIL